MLSALWLWAQMVADVLHRSEFQDYARGWAKISFTAVNFLALYVLVGDSVRRTKLYALGLAVGGVLTFKLVPDPYAFQYPWKFGIGFPITVLVVLAASTRRIRAVPFGPFIMMVGIAAVNFLNGFRSLGGICLLTSVLALSHEYVRRRPQTVRISLGRFVLLGVAAMVTAVSILGVYSRAATSGLLGKAEAAKYSQQAEGRFGVLLGGRSEVFYSTAAIAKSPIIGSGSWSRSPANNTAVTRLREFGYRQAPNAKEQVSAHSYLLGSWVEAGILGMMFWVWILFLAATAIMTTYRHRATWGLLVAFLSVKLVWDVLFSPYGAEARLIAPFSVVVILLVRRAVTVGERVPSIELEPSPS